MYLSSPAPSNECWILTLYMRKFNKDINSLIIACDLCFFFPPVKLCSFNTLIYPSKNIYWQKLWIVNIFNMFLKVQCRYKHMAWTTLLHLEHIVVALERMFGVVQRIQFRCFPFPKRTSLFLLINKLASPDNIIDRSRIAGGGAQ